MNSKQLLLIMYCAVLFITVLISVATGNTSEHEMREAQDRQDEIACFIEHNDTLQDSYQESIRERHGVTGGANYCQLYKLLAWS